MAEGSDVELTGVQEEFMAMFSKLGREMVEEWIKTMRVEMSSGNKMLDGLRCVGFDAAVHVYDPNTVVWTEEHGAVVTSFLRLGARFRVDVADMTDRADTIH